MFILGLLWQNCIKYEVSVSLSEFLNQPSIQEANFIDLVPGN
jgi:hypothetical protein